MFRKRSGSENYSIEMFFRQYPEEIYKYKKKRTSLIASPHFFYALTALYLSLQIFSKHKSHPVLPVKTLSKITGEHPDT